MEDPRENEQVQNQEPVQEHENQDPAPVPDQSAEQPADESQTSPEAAGRKLFIGGLHFATTEEEFFQYFREFGAVDEVLLMRHPDGKSRGFGFVTYKEAAVADKVLATTLELRGRRIDAKKAVPKIDGPLRHKGAVPEKRTCKLFIGGLSLETTEQEFKDYFSKYGTLVDTVIITEKDTRKSRGFGFVTFDKEEAAEAVIAIGEHVIRERKIECKKAVPKDEDRAPRRGERRDDPRRRGDDRRRSRERYSRYERDDRYRDRSYSPPRHRGRDYDRRDYRDERRYDDRRDRYYDDHPRYRGRSYSPPPPSYDDRDRGYGGAPRNYYSAGPSYPYGAPSQAAPAPAGAPGYNGYGSYGGSAAGANVGSASSSYPPVSSAPRGGSTPSYSQPPATASYPSYGGNSYANYPSAPSTSAPYSTPVLPSAPAPTSSYSTYPPKDRGATDGRYRTYGR